MGSFWDGTTPIFPSDVPHTMTSRELRLLFDSLDGLTSAPDEYDNELVRSLGVSAIGLTATDPEGSSVSTSATLRVYRQQPSCIKPRHEVIEEVQNLTACLLLFT